MDDKSTAQDTPIRILIVENREETRETLQNSLTLWGYKPIVAEGSSNRLLEDAEHKAKTYRCHLAIVDKRLVDDGDFTDFSGFNLIESITPTVAIQLTGYADYATARNALRRGAFDVVRKEDGPKALHESIKRAVTEKWRRTNLSIECSPALKSEALVRRLFPNDNMVPIDEIEDILRLLFPNASRLRLELPDGDGSLFSLSLGMRSVVVKVYEDDATRPYIVKISHAKRIQEEIDRFYQVRPYFTAGRYAHIRGEPVQLWDLGGVVYEFIGEDKQYPIKTFADFYAHETSDAIKAAIDNFMKFWEPLYRRRPRQEEPQQESIIVAYTSVWGTDWLQDLVRYQELPIGIELPTLSDTLGLQNPIQWLIKKVKLTSSNTFDASATPHTDLVMCHGDLVSRSLFVDSRRDVWVIDYERTGFGPIHSDFSSLVVHILTQLSETRASLQSYCELCVTLLTPKLIGQPLEPPRNLMRSGDLLKEYRTLVYLWRLTKHTTRTLDAKPFYWGMLIDTLYKYTLFVSTVMSEDLSKPLTSKGMHFETDTTNISCDRMLLLAGLICHRLANWHNVWPPPDWRLGDLMSPEQQSKLLSQAEEKLQVLEGRIERFGSESNPRWLDEAESLRHYIHQLRAILSNSN